MKKTIISVMFLLLLSGCSFRAAKRAFLYWPTDECVREYLHKELHRDWPKAILIMQGDDMTVIKDPDRGAKSDYVILDTLPRCKN
jgi:hypothetical protein